MFPCFSASLLKAAMPLGSLDNLWSSGAEVQETQISTWILNEKAQWKGQNTVPDSYPQSSSRPHTGVWPSTRFVRFLQDSCQCPLLSHEFCKSVIWLCSSIVAACFAPSRWPITTWFYWSFNRPNQIQLPIYVYLLHIKEKEEKHFLMGGWLWYPRISFHFQLGILLLHLTLKEETYSWKSVQKHNLLFYIPTGCPQFILGFWLRCSAAGLVNTSLYLA